MPKFTIITPINLTDWNIENQGRLTKFLKCIESVDNQTFKDFEWIIVDDGSTVDIQPQWNLLMDKGYKIIHTDHNERVVAYNQALKEAKGEWICFLDSDDEYAPNYLEEVDRMIKKFPKYKMFNFGATYISNQENGSSWCRDPFKPKKKKVGHEIFSGGNIVNCTFVFNRSVYQDLGGFPKTHLENIDCTEINYPSFHGAPEPFIRDLYMGTPYDFSAAAQLEFPEIRQFFMVKHPDHPKDMVKELGNPWGQDYYLFYKYTRKYHSKPFKKYLYVVHPR